MPGTVTVKGLSKSYEVFEHPIQRLRSVWFGPRQSADVRRFDALKDVSFEIPAGSSVGVVGRNGSGKSTLLQLIAGTVQPSAGSVSVDGRVAALLELGAGFSPDFTGRENVFMNASILGLSDAETQERLDDILSFAGIGDFIDQPVSTYSSGMVLRLAFAVQIQVEPDILIVDEALAVGDELFQRKCFAAMRAYHERGGTILFVSHSGTTVKEICDSVIMLDAGELVLYADSRRGVDEYHRFLFGGTAARDERRTALQERFASVEPGRAGDGEASTDGAGVTVAAIELLDPELAASEPIFYPSDAARVRDPGVTTLEGEPVNQLIRGRRYRFSYTVDVSMPADLVMFAMMIKSSTGLELGGGTSASHGAELRDVQPGTVYQVSFEFSASLVPGLYYLNCGVSGFAGSYDGVLTRVVDGVALRVVGELPHVSAGYIDFDVASEVSSSSEHGS